MSIQAVYESNWKRLQEAQNNQTSSSSYMDEARSGLTAAPTAPTVADPGEHVYGQEENNKNYTAWLNYNDQKTKYDAESGKRAALSFWDEQRTAYEKANEDTLTDRQAMLEEIAKYKANSLLSNEKLNATLSEEEERLNASATQTIENAEKQFASQGRSADPFVMASLKRKLAMSNQDQLNARRTELEVERSQMHGTYLGYLNETLANTKRNVMDPNTALSFMQQLGSGASSVTSPGMSTGGGGGGGGSQTFRGGGSKYKVDYDDSSISKTLGTPSSKSAFARGEI
ncbi:MAG: hypothetical protein A2017_06635 [Lentisphaerae bacterium GWF2_44_16]|nr:MAG: hypothetical protein A2017_06635 [Lentisphaerae bacterium GWF2_44_16]